MGQELKKTLQTPGIVAAIGFLLENLTHLWTKTAALWPGRDTQHAAWHETWQHPRGLDLSGGLPPCRRPQPSGWFFSPGSLFLK